MTTYREGWILGSLGTNCVRIYMVGCTQLTYHGVCASSYTSSTTHSSSDFHASYVIYTTIVTGCGQTDWNSGWRTPEETWHETSACQDRYMFSYSMDHSDRWCHHWPVYGFTGRTLLALPDTAQLLSVRRILTTDTAVGHQWHCCPCWSVWSSRRCSSSHRRQRLIHLTWRDVLY